MTFSCVLKVKAQRLNGLNIAGLRLQLGNFVKGFVSHDAKVSLRRIDLPKDNKGFRAPSYLSKPFCLRLHKILIKLTIFNIFFLFIPFHRYNYIQTEESCKMFTDM